MQDQPGDGMGQEEWGQMSKTPQPPVSHQSAQNTPKVTDPHTAQVAKAIKDSGQVLWEACQLQEIETSPEAVAEALSSIFTRCSRVTN